MILFDNFNLIQSSVALIFYYIFGAWFIYYVNMKKIDGIYFVGMIPASLALIGWFWIASKLWV